MKNKFREKFGLHPIMTYIILIFVVILISFILSLFHFQSTHKIFSLVTRDYKITSEVVTSLLSLSGLKYIFTNTVSNFANFTILANFLIILIGIGVMESSGFIKTFTHLVTKKASKFRVTFVIVLIGLIASLFTDLMFLILIPLVALIFFHAKRNPILGLVAVFAALTIGSGVSIFLTAIDSALRSTTLLNASVLDPSYFFGSYAFLIINIIIIITLAFIITNITEKFVAKKLPPYEYAEEEEEYEIKNSHLRGIIFAIMMSLFYLIIIIYNIIPNLPFSGNLLDYREALYIDKLFSYDSFFSQGYVFIIAVFFIIIGLSYGKGAKTINNNKEVAESLSSSLDGIGKPLLLIFLAATLISVFKQTNIGVTFITWMANFITTSGFTGLPLIILLFFISMIATLVVPQSIIKWPIIASFAVPAFMSSGLTPEFSQLIFRLGETATLGLTPFFAYFVVYLAYIDKYNQEEKSVNLFTTLKYQMPYALAATALFIVIIIIWYLTGAPLGIGSSVAL